MAKLVLDTNCLIQCLARRNYSHELWMSFIDGRNQLCVTTEILNEYEEVLQRKVDEEFANIIMELIMNNQNTLLVTPVFRLNVIEEDPDDNKFLDCAVAAKALCIVTNDKHFRHLSKHVFPYVEILKLDEAIAMLFGTHGVD